MSSTSCDNACEVVDQVIMAESCPVTAVNGGAQAVAEILCPAHHSDNGSKVPDTCYVGERLPPPETFIRRTRSTKALEHLDHDHRKIESLRISIGTTKIPSVSVDDFILETLLNVLPDEPVDCCLLRTQDMLSWEMMSYLKK